MMSIRCLRKLDGCFYCCTMSRHLHSVSHHMKNTLIFTEEHDELRRTMKKIIEKDINPYVVEWEREKCFPIKDIYRKFANAGLGITAKTEYCGSDLDYSQKVAYVESLKDVNCMSIPFSLLASDIAIKGLMKFGNYEQKKQFLSPSIRGELLLCIGINEEQSDFDVRTIETTAIKKGDDLILNGDKMLVTNGAQADWILILANTSTGNPQRNKSLICVPIDSKGISRSPLMNTLTCNFFFDNVKVPAKYIIGKEGLGYQYTRTMLLDEKLTTSIYAVSILERIIEMTTDHCKQQKVGGKPLIDNEIIRYSLAELQTEMELTRSLVYRTAAQIINGDDYTLLASMAKLKCGRLTREVIDKCLQYWGAEGVSDGSLIGRFFRDCRPLSIAGGVDEIVPILANSCTNF